MPRDRAHAQRAQLGCGAQLLDTRDAAEFEAAHVLGALNVGLGGSYATWCGTILEVEHFVKEKSVTVGNAPGSDFGIPPLLSAKRYSIVVRKGEELILNLDSQMKGVIHRKGRLQTLDEVRRAMHLRAE